MKDLKLIFFLVYSSINFMMCLDNGLARTPPMGWLAWERFQCNVDCDLDPKNCISEKLFMEMAEKIVSDGYKDVGYEYVNIDDCWMSPSRDENGDMEADPDRFPHGIRFLADFMHKRGLKLGLYQDFGTKTCMGYPGIIGHMWQDAKKFSEWNIDMLKLDGCNSKLSEYDSGYVKMGKYLRSFKKSIVYSCSWPYYQLVNNLEPNYTLISSHCNLWRNYHDIQDSWLNLEATINFYGDNQEVISSFIGPGRWSDPDMIIIGNHGLTLGQSRIQMAVWSMIPAPLLMSNDLREISPQAKEILLNKRVIAINQDRLALPGKRVYKKNMIEVWKRKVFPIDGEETSFALLFINKEDSKKSVIKFSPIEFGLDSRNGYAMIELFGNINFGIHKRTDTLKITIPPMDAALLHCKIVTRYRTDKIV